MRLVYLVTMNYWLPPSGITYILYTHLDVKVDAACLLGDDELLVTSIRDYIYFVHREVQADPECLPVLLQEASSLENCLSKLKSLTSKFESLLEDISFPIVPLGYLEKGDSQTWEDEQLQEFTNAFKRLASIEISQLNILLRNPLSTVISLPMQIVLSSLERRFRYHFWGSMKTNRPDKPEWYMTQVLKWIRENDHVLTIIDRDFVSEGGLNRTLRVEFMRGLVQLLLDKLEFDLILRNVSNPRYVLDFRLRSSSDLTAPIVSPLDLPVTNRRPSGELIDNVEYFGHLIDIILQTGARLAQLAYPSDQPNPTDILSLSEVFSRWLFLEKKLASGRLDDLMSTPNAWTTISEENPRPQCAEDFIALLQAVGLRGRQLKDRLFRIRFLRVQLSLIQMFYDRLLAVHAGSQSEFVLKDINSHQKDQSTDKSNRMTGGLSRLFGALGAMGSKATIPLKVASGLSSAHRFTEPQSIRSGRSVAVLNALVHIRDTLLLLGNDDYYITFWEDSTSRALLQVPDPWMVDMGLETDRSQTTSTFDTGVGVGETRSMHHLTGVFEERQLGLHGGVFNTLTQVYQSQIDRMTEETVSVVMNEIECRSGPYIHAVDTWLQPSPVSGITGGVNVDTSAMHWSTAASEMLMNLRDWLFRLSQTVHPKVFAHMWQLISCKLDSFLYKNLILTNRFTPGGAAQLRFDLTHCVFPMFALYTDRPESLFPQTRDSCILLNLLRGSAELLRDSLRSSISGETIREHNPLAPLLELGVYSLTPEEAEVVLSRRTIPD
ncbi:RAD50-interacting protein 1 [Fasciola gigantica]|uniref:RAD50-interacting protein 1 n=1 Tax=Fasciola gigantica TaxID=46835 RepID=A0A504YYB1_FASGI|nr:RAD50-interacting protein 1 [Fasciola gigantica]